MFLGSVFLSASTLNYNVAVWDAESRPIERPKDGEFWRDEGQRSSHLYSSWKITHTCVQKESADRCVTSSFRHAGAERKILYEFQEKLLISNCRCNLLLQCFLRYVWFINSGREKKCFGSWSWEMLKRNGWGENEEGGGMLPLGLIWLAKLSLILHHLSLYNAWVLSWCREKRYFLQIAILGEGGGGGGRKVCERKNKNICIPPYPNLSVPLPWKFRG